MKPKHNFVMIFFFRRVISTTYDIIQMTDCIYCQRLSVVLRELEAQQEIVLSSYTFACTTLREQVFQPYISTEIKLMWASHVLNDKMRLDALCDRIKYWNKAVKEHVESGHLAQNF